MERITAIGSFTAECLKHEVNSIFIEEISSTNTYAKDNFESLSYPAIITTNHQHTGRGRNQNSWIPANTGDCLYITFASKQKEVPPPNLAMHIGLSLYTSLQKVFLIDASIKAPNDIYIGDKKVAGILIEGIHYKNDFYTFIGIGINIYSSPPLSSATHLSAYAEVTKQKWRDFLLLLYPQVMKPKANLQPNEILTLQSALQKNIHHKDLLKIDASGTLYYTDRKIHWQDL